MNLSTIPLDSWSLGVLAGVPVMVIFILIGAGCIVGALFMEYDRWIAVSTGIGVLVVTLGFSAWAFYPYSAQYHKWQTVSGTVTQVNKRILADGDSMKQKFVVTFKGSDQQYGCDDTRCASIHAGDHLSLSCKRAWQYAGTDGWDCNFESWKAGRR